MNNFVWKNGTGQNPVPLTTKLAHRLAEIIRDSKIAKDISGTVGFIEEVSNEDRIAIEKYITVVEMYEDLNEGIEITGNFPNDVFTIKGKNGAWLFNFEAPKGVTDRYDGKFYITDKYVPSTDKLDCITFIMAKGTSWCKNSFPINQNLVNDLIILWMKNKPADYTGMYINQSYKYLSSTSYGESLIFSLFFLPLVQEFTTELLYSDCLTYIDNNSSLIHGILLNPYILLKNIITQDLGKYWYTESELTNYLDPEACSFVINNIYVEFTGCWYFMINTLKNLAFLDLNSYEYELECLTIKQSVFDKYFFKKYTLLQLQNIITLIRSDIILIYNKFLYFPQQMQWNIPQKWTSETLYFGTQIYYWRDNGFRPHNSVTTTVIFPCLEKVIVQSGYWCSTLFSLDKLDRLECLSLKEGSIENRGTQNSLFSDTSKLTTFIAPKLDSVNLTNGLSILRHAPNIQKVIIGLVDGYSGTTDIITNYENYDKLIHLELRKGIKTNLYLLRWTASQALSNSSNDLILDEYVLDLVNIGLNVNSDTFKSNIDMFLMNFKIFIADRLGQCDENDRKILKLSSNVYNAISSDANYNIKLIILSKNWDITI